MIGKIKQAAAQFLLKGMSTDNVRDIINDSTGSGFKSTRGKVVSTDQIIKDGYMTNSDVFSIISKLVNKSVDIPLQLWEVKKGGEKEIVEDGRFFELLTEPNDKQDFIDFMTEVFGYLTLTGNAITRKVRSVGFSHAVDLVVLPTNATEINENGQYIFTDPKTSEQETINPDDIIHISYFSPSENSLQSGMGQSPLQAAFMTVDAGNDLREADQFVLKNRGTSGILTNDSDNTNLNAPMRDEIQRVANKKFGGSKKFNQVLVSSAKLKYTPIGISGNDLKLLESGTIKLRDICNVYSLDSSLFNDPSNKTYNNRKEAEKSMYTNAIQPIISRVLRKFNRDLAQEYSEIDKRAYILEADYSSIEVLQEDQMNEARKDAISTKTLTELLTSDLTNDQKKLIMTDELGFSEDDADKYFVEPVVSVGSLALATPEGGLSAEDQKETSYNGAQITSAVQIIQAVSDESLSHAQGVTALMEFLRVSEDTAKNLLN